MIRTGRGRYKLYHPLFREFLADGMKAIRRTSATLAQKKGTPKDIQALLRHSRLATTTDVYMQEIPESVQATVEAISKELRLKSEMEEDS